MQAVSGQNVRAVDDLFPRTAKALKTPNGSFSRLVSLQAGEIGVNGADAETANPKGRAGNNVNGANVIKSPHAAALEDLGMSRQTAHQYEQMAGAGQPFGGTLFRSAKASRRSAGQRVIAALM